MHSAGPKRHIIRPDDDAYARTTPTIVRVYPALTRGRYSIANQAYVCTTVTARRVPVFREFAAAVEVARQLHALGIGSAWSLLAWVIMPDHVHALVAPQRLPLSECMRLFKGRTSRVLGNGKGLWQRGFHDHALRRDEDLVTVARYIAANPLRAGLVRRIGDYPFWNCVWV
jgi:REP element-mobilizing transposase RayT